MHLCLAHGQPLPTVHPFRREWDHQTGRRGSDQCPEGSSSQREGQESRDDQCWTSDLWSVSRLHFQFQVLSCVQLNLLSFKMDSKYDHNPYIASSLALFAVLPHLNVNDKVIYQSKLVSQSSNKSVNQLLYKLLFSRGFYFREFREPDPRENFHFNSCLFIVMTTSEISRN